MCNQFDWAWRLMVLGLLVQSSQSAAGEFLSPPIPNSALQIRQPRDSRIQSPQRSDSRVLGATGLGRTGISSAVDASGFADLGFSISQTDRTETKLVSHGEPPIEEAVEAINEFVQAAPVAVDSAPAEPLQAESPVAQEAATAAENAAAGNETPSYEEALAETPEIDNEPATKAAKAKPSPNCNCDEEKAAAAAAEKKAALAKAIAGSHKPLHYLNDFSYLDNPAYDSWHLGDSLKQLCVAGTMWDFGGQYRARMHSEDFHRGLGITGNSDDFLLHRTRLYANGQLTKRLRVFGEILDAVSDDETFAPRPIEENRWDIQNAFVDYQFLDTGNATWNARVGRQEVALGDQRYVSVLDWANTRRTFDGVRVTKQSANWTLDGIYLNPMQRNNAFRTKVDRRNTDVRLYGLYASNSSWTKGALDLYWLAYENDVAGFAYDSIGARYKGPSPYGDFLLDMEGAFQFGEGPAADHDAGFFTVGAGKKFADLPFQGTHWLYLDWASGAANGDGHHHYEPLAHKYLGFMDLFGRRNIIDLNWFSVRPLGKNLSFITWAHAFWRENNGDLQTYDVIMRPLPGQPDGSLGRFLGYELDFLVRQSLTPRMNMLYGYSYFGVGDSYADAGVPDASFFYTQFTVNF